MPRPPGVRLNIPYLHGLYLAFNAISDAYFLGDGPSCVFAKAEHIHGRHDLYSTLLSCDSEHRIQYTGVNVFNIAGSFEREVAEALRRIAESPGCGAIFTGAMPMCAIAGTDYERIMREALARCDKPAYLIPRRAAFGGDWLDGYAGALDALAAGMPLARPRRRSGAVAVVGYLMDRNEGDHLGNLAELRRLLRALGLEAVSIWLSGGSHDELARVAEAGTIVSLPYGRRAARRLAERLGARLVEAELPFGLAGTKAFVESVAAACGREARAEAFLAAELAEAARRLEWSVPHAFMHRRFAFAGDPHHAAGFAELVEELGGTLAAAVITAAPEHRRLERPNVLYEPERASLRALFEETAPGVDLLVCNSLALKYVRPRCPWLELGFPSEHTHFLADEPYLGPRGALALCSRMANELVKGRRAREAAR